VSPASSSAMPFACFSTTGRCCVTGCVMCMSVLLDGGLRAWCRCLTSPSRRWSGDCFCHCPWCGGKVCIQCLSLCTGPKTVLASTHPSPKGQYSACQGKNPGRRPAISAEACICCVTSSVAGVLRPVRWGGLGVLRMMMTLAAASLLVLWPAVFVF